MARSKVEERRQGAGRRQEDAEREGRARIEVPPPAPEPEVHPPPTLRITWERLGAVSGVAFVLFTLGAFLVAPEPPQGGDPVGTIQDYFTDHRVRILTQAYLFGGAMVMFLWFLGTIRAELRHGNERLSAIAYGGGIATVAAIGASFAYPAALAAGLAKTGDPNIVRALFEVGGMTERMAAFPWAVFVGAASLAMIRTGLVSRLLGWTGVPLCLAILASVGGIYVERGAWAYNGDVGGAVILAFLAWMLAAAVLLVLRPPHDSKAVARKADAAT